MNGPGFKSENKGQTSSTNSTFCGDLNSLMTLEASITLRLLIALRVDKMI